MLKKMRERGFVGLYLAVVVLVLMLGIITSIAFGVLAQQRIIKNTVQSARAYAAAESGLEDGLLRLHNSLTLPGAYPYSLEVGSAQAQITISPLFFGSRTVTSSGNSLGRVRIAEAVYEIKATDAEFFFGAHVGEGGLELGNQSDVLGNVFSNGDVSLGNNAGIGTIFGGISGSVEIAKVGGRLYCTAGCGGASPPFVNGNATVDICEEVLIVNDLNANTSNGCGAIDTPLGAPPASIPLPFDDPALIQGWKDTAAAGGTITGDYTVPAFTTVSLGRKKITGNLLVDNGATLVVTGTLWVVGNIDVKNDADVHLDAGYGSTSGIIVADGKILLDNNSVSSGSGQAGSYLMYLSTSTDAGSEAIALKNNAQADILYTNNSTILIDNNARLREVAGDGIRLGNNARLVYEIGLQNVTFVNGTGGGWEVTSWKEIE
ncbi:MAG: hypothetical protein A2564_03455 [Candidatus Wildermuthbacteria bacterium RIFOXYD1_FULL_50_12]|nr:MAG: hypothetical protein A2564_03455 [Candidatus Wildermuthbacteria bacterium RIFOXYD1_FULL_50_12]